MTKDRKSRSRGRPRRAALRRLAGIINAFFVQLPTMVLLMIMAYVIFGHSALPILIIVIIGLTLKAAAYLAEIFDTALSTVQPGEIEAARTLGMQPEVILFDEPTSALDPTMVDEVESVIRGLVDEGLTSVLVTHEMRFARKVASKVVFLAEKGIYEQGAPEQVFDHPEKVLTQRFLYRSRMFEQELTADALDLYALASALRAFLRRYDYETRQEKLIELICDELLYPVFHSAEAPAQSASLRLLCSETSARHTLLISFPGLTGDPLAAPYLDELNLRLLGGFSEFIFSREKDGGREVCIQI